MLRPRTRADSILDAGRKLWLSASRRRLVWRRSSPGYSFANARDLRGLLQPIVGGPSIIGINGTPAKLWIFAAFRFDFSALLSSPF